MHAKLRHVAGIRQGNDEAGERWRGGNEIKLARGGALVGREGGCELPRIEQQRVALDGKRDLAQDRMPPRSQEWCNRVLVERLQHGFQGVERLLLLLNDEVDAIIRRDGLSKGLLDDTRSQRLSEWQGVGCVGDDRDADAGVRKKGDLGVEAECAAIMIDERLTFVIADDPA